MKSFLLLFLTFILFITCIPAGNKDFETAYYIKEDSSTSESVGIYSYKGKNKSVVIPNLINGSPVTAIFPNSFQGRNLTNIIIPEGIYEIGMEAFKDNLLTSIVFPQSLAVIGNNAFSNNSLTSITIGKNVFVAGSEKYSSFDNDFASVYYENFQRAGIYELIEGRWTYIVESIFVFDGKGTITFYPGNETSIEIPSHINGIPVTIIGEGAFRNKNLTSVVIPDTVLTIEPHAFADNDITSIVIPDSVQTIGEMAFVRNERLSSVIFGAGLISIGEDAFSLCPLRYVVIPANVEVRYINIQQDWPPYDITNVNTPLYGNGFENFYHENGRVAGTYIFENNRWKK
ncbi:MAG: leucine-rich repeat domain-containing protein [Treponema sp.]|nr:leucine-rich repeat domain-containing protein [Treponema sp.]